MGLLRPQSLVHLWLHTLLPLLLPMQLFQQLILLPMDMLDPSTSTPSWWPTPMVLSHLLMSQLLLLPVLNTSPPRELSMLLRPQSLRLPLLLPMLLPLLVLLLTPMEPLSPWTPKLLLPPVLPTSSPRESMAEYMLTLHPWLPMVVSFFIPMEPLSQLMILLSQQQGPNTSLSRANLLKNLKNQLVC